MEAKSDSSTSSTFRLLQPELLTVEELSEILKTCCVKNDLTSCSKSELVELFKRVALPLPQREYGGNNWREKLLSKNQKRKSSLGESVNLKRICTTNGSTKNSKLTVSTNVSHQSSKSTPSPGSSAPSRLKPPININNYTKKVLKLALPNSKSTDCSTPKKIIITEKNEIKSTENNVSSASQKSVPNDEKSNEKIVKNLATSSSSEKQPLSNGKHKRIVIDFSDSSTTTTKTPKVVNLKRSNSNSEMANTGPKVRKTINI